MAPKVGSKQAQNDPFLGVLGGPKGVILGSFWDPLLGLPEALSRSPAPVSRASTLQEGPQNRPQNDPKTGPPRTPPRAYSSIPHRRTGPGRPWEALGGPKRGHFGPLPGPPPGLPGPPNGSWSPQYPAKWPQKGVKMTPKWVILTPFGASRDPLPGPPLRGVLRAWPESGAARRHSGPGRPWEAQKGSKRGSK